MQQERHAPWFGRAKAATLAAANHGIVASDPTSLTNFVRAAKQRGATDDALVALLRQRGWPERRAFDALAAYYEGELGMPVPARGSRLENARDAFLYLLSFIALGFWTVAMVWLADVLIDRTFPSPLDSSYGAGAYYESVAGQLASIIIAFPLFMFVSRLIGNEIARRPEAIESGVRKWLTYVALVIAAVTMLGDAIAFLAQFLAGDLTIRFALKAFVLFVVTAGIFWYYLGTVRAENISARRDRAFGWAAVGAVCVALVLGFLNTGSPARVRAIILDQRRVQNIQNIADAIHSSWVAGQTKPYKLPPDLSAVTLTAAVIEDPVTKRPYEYVRGLKTSYRICATFATEERNANPPAWNHPAGRHCFAFDARRAPTYPTFATHSLTTP